MTRGASGGLGIGWDVALAALAPARRVERRAAVGRLRAFDPPQLGMLGVARSPIFGSASSGRPSNGRKAIGRPNAHAHILAIAASTIALTNRLYEAQKLVARIRERSPAYGVERAPITSPFSAPAMDRRVPGSMPSRC